MWAGKYRLGISSVTCTTKGGIIQWPWLPQTGCTQNMKLPLLPLLLSWVLTEHQSAPLWLLSQLVHSVLSWSLNQWKEHKWVTGFSEQSTNLSKGNGSSHLLPPLFLNNNLYSLCKFNNGNMLFYFNQLEVKSCSKTCYTCCFRQPGRWPTPNVPLILILILEIYLQNNKYSRLDDKRLASLVLLDQANPLMFKAPPGTHCPVKPMKWDTSGNINC